MEETAGVVDDSDAVGVPVGGDSDVIAVVCDVILQRFQGVSVGGRELSRKQGVVAAVNGLHIAAGGGEDGLQGSLAHAVEGIQHHPQAGVPDGLHVQAADDAVQVLVQRVELLDQAGFDPVLVAQGGNFIALAKIRLHLVDVALQVGGLCLVRVPPAPGEHLEPVVEGGVVAGGDHHAVVQVVGHDVEHDQGGGGGAVYELDGDALGGQDLRRPLHRLLGQKAPVVADGQAGEHLLPLHFSGHGLRQNADVGFDEIISDDGSPATGSKANAHDV